MAGTHYAADHDVQQQFAAIRNTIRARAQATFAPELAPVGARAELLVDMLLAATSLDVWTSLRTTYHDRPVEARAALQTIARGIFLAADLSREPPPTGADTGQATTSTPGVEPSSQP
jgi:hypothetical protein